MAEKVPFDLDLLDRAIARLRPFEREVFMLHRLDGLSCGAVGERMGITVDEVERILARVLTKLRRRTARGQRFGRWFV